MLGLFPRRAALRTGRIVARVAYRFHRRLRQTAEQNLKLAMPELSPEERDRLVRAVFDNLGRLLGEFSQFHKLNRTNIEETVRYEGLENYLRAAAQGRGVLLLTGHFGAWELCAFAHGCYGYPLSFLVRPLDNALLDNLINAYRQRSGNRIIDKNAAVRPVLKTLREGGSVGMLIDANTMREEGVFCDFFGVMACSTSGLAVLALRSGAPVVPGFLIWDEEDRIHTLTFGPEVRLVRTGDFKEEVRVNTARFTKIIEEQARRHPDQWLWVHRRWNTRPEGEHDLYATGAEGRDSIKDSTAREARVG